MQMKVDLSDLEKMSSKTKNVSGNIEKSISDLVDSVSTTLKEQSVKNTRSGVLYRDGVYETGRLRNNIEVKLTGPQKGKVFVNPTKVPYAKYVEPEKPFMKPSIKQKEKEIDEIISKSIKDIL